MAPPAPELQVDAPKPMDEAKDSIADTTPEKQDPDPGPAEKDAPQDGSSDEDSSDDEDATSESSGRSALVKQIRREMEKLEQRLKKLEDTEPQNSKSPEKSFTPAHAPISKYTPEVRWCNWEDFKNRYEEEHCLHAVEVLMAGSQLHEEMKQEIGRRDDVNAKIFNPERQETEFSLRKRKRHDQSNDLWIRRVRIQSKTVLRILGKIKSKHGLYPLDLESTTTFMRPFKSLIYFQEEVKSTLRRLEEAASPEPEARESDPKQTVESSTGDIAAAADGPDDSSDTTPVHLDELRCYVNFVDEHLMPQHQRLRSDPVDPECPKKVRFEDLWHLFKPGELVYVVPQPTRQRKSTPTTAQQVWRMWNFNMTKPEWRVTKLEKEHLKSRGRKNEPKDTDETEDDDEPRAQVSCYYLDHSGTSYCAVYNRFSLDFYEGEMDITSLPVYPLRFVPNRDTVVRDLKKERENYHKYVSGRKHLVYEGWSVIHDVLGGPIEDENGDQVKHRQFINSEVIIDFEEALAFCPAWRPNFLNGLLMNIAMASWATDPFSVKRWDSKKRSKVLSQFNEIYEDDGETGVALLEDYSLLGDDRFLDPDRRLLSNSVFATSHTPAQKASVITELTEEESMLVPTRLFAYILNERRFAQVDIRNIREMDFEAGSKPFEDLELDLHNKNMVLSLINTHIENRNKERGPGMAVLSQDLIRGKGRGLVMLLHGAPGVGKTATAESIAMSYKKPLFSITCGDLGTDASTVEHKMKEIFRLAHLWDCVLLLDEADVFLSRRQVTDLERNALVSVMLRILEYYPGILFLTTNQPGVLDEAVKSRVHVSLHYPALSKEQTLKIFEMNLRRLEAIEQARAGGNKAEEMVIDKEEILDFAAKHYEKYGTDIGSWNGRQIRNAFQIAASLAHYDHFKKKGFQAQLRALHFVAVADATYKYDWYRAQVISKTDAENARANEHRHDIILPPESVMMGQQGPGWDYQRRPPMQPQPPQWGGASMGYQQTPYTPRYAQPPNSGFPQTPTSGRAH